MDKQQPTPQVIFADSAQAELTEEQLQKAPGKIKLLLDPLLYARGAAACISDQLLGVKSAKRKLKLEAKLEHWNKVIEVLTEDDANGNKENTEG